MTRTQRIAREGLQFLVALRQRDPRESFVLPATSSESPAVFSTFVHNFAQIFRYTPLDSASHSIYLAHQIEPEA